MTRKDYVAFATALRSTHPSFNTNGLIHTKGFNSISLVQWDKDVDALIKVLRLDNHKFDEERFREALLAE